MKKIISLILILYVSYHFLPIARAFYRPLITAFEYSKANKCIVIDLTDGKEPVVSYEKNDSSLIIEFPDYSISKKINKKAIAAEGIKLAYLADYSVPYRYSRLKIYTENDKFLSIKTEKNKISLFIRANEDFEDGISTNNLLAPKSKQYSPVILQLQEAPLIPVLQKLSDSAGLQLKLSGVLPQNINLEIEAPSPEEAIKHISDKYNLKFYRTEKYFWISS